MGFGNVIWSYHASPDILTVLHTQLGRGELRVYVTDFECSRRAYSLDVSSSGSLLALLRFLAQVQHRLSFPLRRLAGCVLTGANTEVEMSQSGVTSFRQRLRLRRRTKRDEVEGEATMAQAVLWGGSRIVWAVRSPKRARRRNRCSKIPIRFSSNVGVLASTLRQI